MKHNEDTRVKIPTILHLIRLGYDYLSLKEKELEWDHSTNIFTDIFTSSIKRINPDCSDDDIQHCFDELSLCLDNEDLGRAFYEKLLDKSAIRLIDFEQFDNNAFNVVTELPYQNGDESFRPDIILLINGMPLVFIEVKKPNNLNGILAEHERIEKRFKNKKFRKFVNITQLMLFSNNMEYDDSSPQPIEGAFYASPSYKKPHFNYFREQHSFNLKTLLHPADDAIETTVLKDNNLLSIKASDDFSLNKEPDTPTNRLCTSLLQRKRLAFLLEFALTYVKTEKGLEKHIMRYPQLFATKAIEQTLEAGTKKGIIWHTQGSGKTALAYYNVKYLTHYFRHKSVIAKFYFIVDRIDLLNQAGKAFRARGLVVHNIDSREAFANDIKQAKAIHNDTGKTEITVVNIQKFADDPNVIKNTDYQLNIQRVFFLDEVHRSYNPKGSFLANLEQTDKNAIKIGLTGTPLLGKIYNSKNLFGHYIHQYYYNASIKDGYTLRLIREDIETSYKLTLQKALENIKVLKGNTDKKVVYAHPTFVEPMLNYIVQDMEQARFMQNNATIGGMVVCDSSAQAKMMYDIFQQHVAPSAIAHIAEAKPSYNASQQQQKKITTAALILHDIGTKQERKQQIEDFKDGKIDLLFVFNMLLTGFDAPRLKKLYIGRVIKAHNLLQALTRVNRTYQDFTYGYVVDFADIQAEFDKTNHAYFQELQSELGDEIEHYSDLFKSSVEIEQEIQQIKTTLLYYNTQSLEIFSQQISQIDSRADMLDITRALNNAKSLYNLIRLSGDDTENHLQQLDFKQLNVLAHEAKNRLALINLKESLANKVDTTPLLNIALEDAVFDFHKVDESEMLLVDTLKNTFKRTRQGLSSNFDPQDPEFIRLKEELERLFKQKNLTDVSKEPMKNNIKALDNIYNQAKALEKKNQLLKAQYDHDEKYVRLHKRLMEKELLTKDEGKLLAALKSLKMVIDQEIKHNEKVLENENFAAKMMLRSVITQLKTQHQLPLNPSNTRQINALVVKEYINEYHGVAA